MARCRYLVCAHIVSSLLGAAGKLHTPGKNMSLSTEREREKIQKGGYVPFRTGALDGGRGKKNGSLSSE